MKLDWPARNRSIGIVDALAITGLAGLLVARFVPIARLPFWGCALRQSTGIPCLGCGLTRVADHVSHFDLPAAWAANPGGTLGALVFVACIVASVAHLLFAVPIPKVTLSSGERLALKAALVSGVVVNYAYLVVKAKFPSLLAGG